MTPSTENVGPAQPVQFVDTDLPNIIELKNVGQRYGNSENWIIRGLDLLIEKPNGSGEFVMILGPSGCGKSTILRYIAGLQKPTEGEVFINAQLRPEELPISMVFQKYSSMPCYSVLDNVALPLLYRNVPLKQRHEHAMEMIKLVGLEGHEHKYATERRLSGGQLQRVALARSLVANPDIILLDEPFSALDTRTRLEMQLLVFSIWKKLKNTIVFVTHDPREAVFLADDIYLMRKNPGQIFTRFPVDLEFERDMKIKREKKFLDLVDNVENALMAMDN